MSNVDLMRRIRYANEQLKSELLTEAHAALAEHPVTVSQAELEQARHDGALSVLRLIVARKPSHQAGHPEEETRELDNIDVRRIAERVNVSVMKVWAGIS